VLSSGLVAIASSSEAFDLPGLRKTNRLKLKRLNLKKVTKETGALDLEHRGAMSCGREERGA
jgi:hypothetical protein